MRVLLLQELRNSLELDVTRAFIDSPDLAITEHFLSNPFPDESHAAHPLDSGAGHAAGDLRGVQLGHGGVLDEVLAGFLLAGGVVDQGARGGDLGVGLGELVLHALEVADELAELATVVPDVAVKGENVDQLKMHFILLFGFFFVFFRVGWMILTEQHSPTRPKQDQSFGQRYQYGPHSAH